MSKALNQPATQLEQGIAYVDPDAKPDVKDVLHQIEWYKAQGM